MNRAMRWIAAILIVFGMISCGDSPNPGGGESEQTGGYN
jgi:hypothetical protein